MGTQETDIQIRKLWPVAVVCGSFVLGVFGGCLFASLTGDNTARQLRDYLADYLTLAGDAGIAGSFGGAVWAHGRWLFLCVLGIIAGFGIFVIPVLVVVRGFLLSFGIGCFVRFFGLAGLIPAGVIFGIPAVFWLPGLLLTAIPGLSVRSVARHGIGTGLVTTGIGRNVRVGIVLSTLLFVLCVFLEYSLLPVLLPLAANILGYGGVSGG